MVGNLVLVSSPRWHSTFTLLLLEHTMLGGTNRSGADSVDRLGRLHVGHAVLAVHAAPNTRQILVC